MMSPLSVSLLLQNKDYQFDVIIFDEASQIKPENAIGSIIRGKQIIIAGDTHQLPPTSFFEKGVNDEDLYDGEGDDDEDFALEESILDAGNCRYSGCPHTAPAGTTLRRPWFHRWA